MPARPFLLRRWRIVLPLLALLLAALAILAPCPAARTAQPAAAGAGG